MNEYYVKHYPELRKARMEGYSISMLAEKFGLTLATVERACKDLKPDKIISKQESKIRETKKRNEKIIAAYQAGKSRGEIMKEFNVSESVVHKVLSGIERLEPKSEPSTEMIVPRSVHSPVKVYHISELPPSEQERIMNLNDRYREEKKSVGWIVR